MIVCKKPSCLSFFVAILWILTTVGTPYGKAAERKPVAEEWIRSYGIAWTAKVDYAEILLTISRPDGSIFQKTFPRGESLFVDVSAILGEEGSDGSYIYEMHRIPDLASSVRPDENLSPRQKKKMDPSILAEDSVQSGSFFVSGGSIMSPFQTEIGPQTMPKGLLPEDQVVADDLVVTGSACFGFDCVNNESFGFDTIRLKENNLRIKFEDTSATAGFPANDWQITVNDSASGGANHFSIEDISGSRVPFTLTAGAPTNSLFVSNAGRLGLKTATPAMDIHISNGNTPTIRLEQNGTSGFSPYTFDVGSNEANFFIRDVTGGSKLPFRIQSGTPTNTLMLRSDGSVGIGTPLPVYPLEVATTGKNASMACSRSDGARSLMSATDTFGQFGTYTNHPLQLTVNNSSKMQLNADSSITMANGARLTAGGTWQNASSRELKENIQALTGDEAFDTLNRLNAVKYNYKVDREERHVGFIAEDAPELVSSKDKKAMGSMDVVAVLTKVVQEQQKSLRDQQATIEELKKKIESMEKK